MQIFLSYAAVDAEQAQAVALSLRNRGHVVFFDKDDLPGGGSFGERISAALGTTDVFVFLISPNSVKKGCYALTEAKIFSEQWPVPKGRVIPVLLEPTPFDTVPAYIKAVTILEPAGNIAEEVVFELERLRGWQTAQKLAFRCAIPGLLLGFASGFFPTIPRWESDVMSIGSVPAFTGLIAGGYLGFVVWLRQGGGVRGPALIFIATLMGWILCVTAIMIYLQYVDIFSSPAFSLLEHSIRETLSPVPESILQPLNAVKAELQDKADLSGILLFIIGSLIAGAIWMVFVLAALATVDVSGRNIGRWGVGVGAASLAAGLGVIVATTIGWHAGAEGFIQGIYVESVYYRPIPGLSVGLWLGVASYLLAFWLTLGRASVF